MPSPDAQLRGQQLNADQVRIVAPRLVPPPVPAVTAQRPGVCVEWGSFGAAALPKAQAALGLLGIGERTRTIDVAVTTSYWVYIAPLGSQPDMNRKANALKQLGVTDYSTILEPGRWRYAISLGVFRNEDAAKKHLALLRRKGVRGAQLGEREQRVTQTALLVQNPSEAQSAQLVNLKADYPGSELRLVDCPPS
ncbi:MAG: SPOR domain-containing protein [Betaproteobacteria bacterium]